MNIVHYEYIGDSILEIRKEHNHGDYDVYGRKNSYNYFVYIKSNNPKIDFERKISDHTSLTDAMRSFLKVFEKGNYKPFEIDFNELKKKLVVLPENHKYRKKVIQIIDERRFETKRARQFEMKSYKIILKFIHDVDSGGSCYEIRSGPVDHYFDEKGLKFIGVYDKIEDAKESFNDELETFFSTYEVEKVCLR